MALESTTTLLEAVNRVLLDVGERQVLTITNPASRKAAAYLREAFEDFQTFHDWSYTLAHVVPSVWDEDKATVQNVKRIREVFWDDGTRVSPIPFIDLVAYNQYPLIPFDLTESTNRPARFTISNNYEIRCNPYPTDTTGKTKVKVLGYVLYEPPVNSSDKFKCPQEYITTIIKRAVYQMTLRHLGELNEAQMLNGEFEIKLRYLANKDKNALTGGVNMFRRHTNYGLY